MKPTYEQGRSDRKAFVTSQGFSSISRTIRGEDALLIFFPNVQQDLMQVARPMPPDRKEWLKGWDDEKTEEGIG